MKLFVSSELKQRWTIDERNILESRSVKEGCPVFKFCYDPTTGEFLCDLWPSFHKDIIERYGQKEFANYIRGIYFKEKKIVYLRQHEIEEWLVLTERFLRGHGVTEDMRIIWGEAANHELACELRGL